MTLSMILMIGAILVVRSLQHALNVHLGFQPEHAAVLSLDLPGQGYDLQRSRDFQHRLLSKVRALAGVQDAAMSTGLPLSPTNDLVESIYVEGRPVLRAADLPAANVYAITPGYLRTMETRLMSGRDIDSRDAKDAPLVALVNETFARKLFPGETPTGRRFRHNAAGKWIQIAGVVEDGKYGSLNEAPELAVFEPIEQRTDQGHTLIVRSPLPETETLRLMRRAVLDLDPSLTIFEDGGLANALGPALFPAKIAAVVLGSFGVLAVILASTGVYGIMAYAVSRRTREIGIRMALGAAPAQVARTVLTKTMRLLAVSIAIGFAAAFAAGSLFSPLLYGISAHDPATYLFAIATIVIVGATACWIPARRAIHIDPLTALRTD